MKSTKFISTFLLVFLLAFTSCEKDDGNSGGQQQENIPDTFSEYFGNEISRDFLGTVIDKNNNPIVGVTITIGNETASTDSNGVFIIRDANVNERFGYIKAEKIGYMHGSRSVVPSNGINKVTIMLLDATVVGTVNSGSSETVSLSNGSSVSFDGNFVKEDGSAYSGSVNVIMHHLDPTNENINEQMPGMLYAENEDGAERMLQTLGMLAVELRGTAGEDLNLAEGSTSEIKIPVDASLMAMAPASIPLWYFDEVNGYWKEEGQATLQGNMYVGTVSHFSFWNCDIPAEAITLCVSATDNENNPLNNLYTTITSSTFGTTGGYINDSGQVCGYVPSGETLELNIYSNDVCAPGLIYSNTIGPFTSDSSTNITLLDFSTSNLITETVTGNFLTCDDNPVNNGYVKITYGEQQLYHWVDDGTFEFNFIRCTETTSFELEAVDYQNLDMADSQTIEFDTPLTDVGILQACATLNSEYIQYTNSLGNLLTLPVTSAGINASETLAIGYSNPLVFGGASFSLRINNYTTPGDYIGSMGIGDFTSDIPFAQIVMLPYDEFDGVVTVISAGESIGDFMTLTFSGTVSSSFSDYESPIDGVIQAIRSY